jgi:protein SCO1/2
VRSGFGVPFLRYRVPEMTKKPRVLGALILVGVANLATSSLARSPQRSAAELMDVVMWNREPIGGPFALTDQTGQPRSDADFRGKLMLVYFGFTNCPDICPTDLQQMGLVALHGDYDSLACRSRVELGMG